MNHPRGGFFLLPVGGEELVVVVLRLEAAMDKTPSTETANRRRLQKQKEETMMSPL